MIKALVKYIENETSLVIGTNLFAGFVPSTITADYAVVIETGGSTQPDIKDYVEKTIQVLCVAKEYFSAVSMAETIYSLLHASAGVSLPVVVAGKEYLANTIVAIASHQSLGQDEKGRFILSTNYVARIKNANL